MTESIAVALIGLGGSAVGSLIGVWTSGRLTQYRLEQLEKKVDSHNNLIDRMYKREEHDNVVDERLKELGRRMDGLEGSK